MDVRMYRKRMYFLDALYVPNIVNHNTGSLKGNVHSLGFLNCGQYIIIVGT